VSDVEIFKTKTIDGAGKTPKWEEECDHEVKDLSAAVKFIVSDEDYNADDVVGEGSTTLQTFANGDDVWLEIAFNGKASGTVRFVTSYVDFTEARE